LTGLAAETSLHPISCFAVRGAGTGGRWSAYRSSDQTAETPYCRRRHPGGAGVQRPL